MSDLSAEALTVLAQLARDALATLTAERDAAIKERDEARETVEYWQALAAGEMQKAYLIQAGPDYAQGGFEIVLKTSIGGLLAESMVEMLRSLGAENYVTTTVMHPDMGPMAMTVGRVHGETPAQKLATLTAERDALKARAETAERQRNDILAIIHRDGGHYTEEHGEAKSVEDAIQVWASLMVERDALKARVEEQRRSLHQVTLREIDEIAAYQRGAMEMRERAASIFSDAIDAGYPAPPPKGCDHGRLDYEDCISCYDNALNAAVEIVRAIPIETPGNAGVEATSSASAGPNDVCTTPAGAVGLDAPAPNNMQNAHNDPDGWLPHTPGDPQPVEGDVMVDVRLRDGHVTKRYHASSFRWGAAMSPEGPSWVSEIIAYRVLPSQPKESKDGE